LTPRRRGPNHSRGEERGGPDIVFHRRGKIHLLIFQSILVRPIFHEYMVDIVITMMWR
jgi:hypothetical protein